jgi:hypothetical protein
MSLARLRERTPGARRLATCLLRGHSLRFHKAGRDGSGKCDAYATGNPGDVVIGALFEICPGQKSALDAAEGLGAGYEEKAVVLEGAGGGRVAALTYYATAIDESLRPYCWYKRHVLVGARESALPPAYVARIDAIATWRDPDPRREARQLAVHGVSAPTGPVDRPGRESGAWPPTWLDLTV